MDGKENKDFGYKQELKRSLSLRDMVIYGMIFMVPIAPFGIYGGVVTGAKGMIALVYVIGMCAMIFTALSYKRMAEEFPIAGSVYSYAQRSIHPTVGFLTGWAMLMDYILVPGLLYVVSASALQGILPSVPKGVWLVVFIVINTAINIRGIEFTAKANMIMLAAELIVLAIFIVLGIAFIASGKGHGFTLKPLYDKSQFSIHLVMAAVSVAVLSFLGFDGISTLSEEAKDGPKSIGKACIISLFAVGILFIIQTYIAGCAWPDYTTFKNSDNAFYEIAQRVGGRTMFTVCSVATVISWGIANALAAQAAVARILYSMGRDKNLPSVLAKIHPKYQTPYFSTLFIAVISLAVGFLFLNNIDAIASLVNFGALAAFCVLHVSVIVHFIIKKKSKQYIKHLVLPLIGFLIVGFVWVNLDNNAKILGFVWFAVGIIYLIVMKLIKKDVVLEDL